MKNKIILAMYRREDMKTWTEAKKAWVRLEAKKLAARGVVPIIQDLGLINNLSLLLMMKILLIRIVDVCVQFFKIMNT